MSSEITDRLMQMRIAKVDEAEQAYKAATGENARHVAFLHYVAQMQLLHIQSRNLFPPTPRDREPFQIPPHDQAPTSLASDATAKKDPTTIIVSHEDGTVLSSAEIDMSGDIDAQVADVLAPLRALITAVRTQADDAQAPKE